MGPAAAPASGHSHVFLEGPAALSSPRFASVGLRPLRSFCFTLISDTPTLSLPARPLPIALQPPRFTFHLFRTSQHSSRLFAGTARLARLRGRDPDTDISSFLPRALFDPSQTANVGFYFVFCFRILFHFPFARSIPPTPHRQPPAGPLRAGPSFD